MVFFQVAVEERYYPRYLNKGDFLRNWRPDYSTDYKNFGQMLSEQEPLFHNPEFHGPLMFFRTVQENMLRKNCTRLKDLVNPDGWKSVEDINVLDRTVISTVAGSFFRSNMLFLLVYYREVMQRKDGNEQTDIIPQKLFISSTYDTSLLEDHPIEGSKTSETWTIEEMSLLLSSLLEL